MATKSAAVSSKYKSSPFRLRVNITPRGVFFDRIGGDSKEMMIHTTEVKARRLAQWIIDNTSESQAI